MNTKQDNTTLSVREKAIEWYKITYPKAFEKGVDNEFILESWIQEVVMKWWIEIGWDKQNELAPDFITNQQIAELYLKQHETKEQPTTLSVEDFKLFSEDTPENGEVVHYWFDGLKKGTYDAEKNIVKELGRLPKYWKPIKISSIEEASKKMAIALQGVINDPCFIDLLIKNQSLIKESLKEAGL